jgi:glycosyltransferase involved in cell wall biosynthesis
VNAAPRVLFLSQRFLFPLDTGGKIRTGKILEHLRRVWDITLIGNYDPERDAPHLARMQALCSRYLPVKRRERRRGSPWWYLDILQKSAASHPISVLNDTSAALKKAVEGELASGGYDLFVCDFLQSTLNVPLEHGCPSLLFTHNVETRIARRHAEQARNALMKAFWKRQHRLMRAYEGRTAARFDRVIAVSESDRLEFETAFGLANVRTIPTGVDTEELQASGRPSDPGAIVFCGSMDWLPNQEGVRWFAESILPEVLRQAPEAHLTVVGRSPPRGFSSSLSSSLPVRFTGWVEDVRPYIDRAACYVVPLRIGGGTRIKIYEAMAMERAVVSTSIGAEGLPIEHGTHFYRADDEEAFAARVVERLRDPEGSKAIGRRAREYVRLHFDWRYVAEVFAAIGGEIWGGRRPQSKGLRQPRVGEEQGTQIA